MSASASRKPVESSAAKLPALMRALGIPSWTNVPNETLQAWIDDDHYPLWFRVLAMCARQSFGYQQAEVESGAVLCVRKDGRELVRLTQRDIAERLSAHHQHISRAMQALEQRGQVRFSGQRIFMVARPVPLPEAPEELSKGTTDGAISPLEESIKSGYKLATKVIRECYFQTLKLTTSDAAYKEERNFLKGETESEWVSRFLTTVVRALQEQINEPTDPLPLPSFSENERLQQLEAELAEKQRRIDELEAVYARNGHAALDPDFANDEAAVREYLNQFTRALHRPPREEIVCDVRQRLGRAPLLRLELLATKRFDEGLKLTGWGIFSALADEARAADEIIRTQDAQMAANVPADSAQPDDVPVRQYWTNVLNDPDSTEAEIRRARERLAAYAAEVS